MSQEKRIEYLLAQNRELVKELFRFDYLLNNTKAILAKQQKAFKLLVEIQKVIGFSRNDKELFNEVASLIDSTLEMAATYIYEASELHEGVYNLVCFHDTYAEGSIDPKELETITQSQWPEYEKYLVINSKKEECTATEEIKKRFRLSSLIIHPVSYNDCTRLIIITGIRVIDETVLLDLTPEDVAAIEAVGILISSYFRKTEFIKLYEADRFKTEFISNVSHEFRTPLTLVLGLLEQLKTGMDPGEEAGRLESLGVVINNALRLRQLIDQLLDMSRLETDSERLMADSNSLGDLVTRIAKSFFAIAGKSGIEFIFSIAGNFEDSWFDEDKLEKILTNILDNAFKYTSEKGKVEFSVSEDKSRKGETRAVLVVSDTGPGIPTREKEKIFERFYRSAGNGDSAAGGTGIGLYLVSKLVALHHGTVEVDSQPGQGSTFTVRIPVNRNAYSDSELASSSVNTVSAPGTASMPQAGSTANALPAPAATQLAGKRQQKSRDENPANRLCILIVEDNKELNSFIAGSLSREWTVLEAFDGEEGFAAAVQNIPDLIVTDVMMPVTDGYELCRRIKQNEKTGHIPVIILTARADRQSTITGLDCGADDYISKPFDMLELSFKIRNHLETSARIRDRYRREFLTTPDEAAIPIPQDTLLQKVISLMKEHIANPDFHVSSLCSELYISRTQLYRKIEAMTGYSPAGLLRSIRLKTAAAMFRKGHSNVAQVMYRVGFSSQSNFARHFREQFGVNPSAYISRQPDN
ncbi:MAG: ATP-binding protein [Bacteroidales bacterium]|nr:ATP-binding protein [Bacteroidales bacterium]MDT8373727.1 ATP-binding protein [Bacteroidales bacterium]